MGLPSHVKAEVKLTTGAHVAVSARELGALDVQGDVAGVVCGIFVGGDPETDGRWIVGEARPLLGRAGDSVAVSRKELLALARRNPSLDRLRGHVATLWPSFFAAWKGASELGHRALLDALGHAHREGSLLAELPSHEVLAMEHRGAIHGFVERHGEHEAGRLAQDMLVYVMASAGYAKVTNNPIGVPDFELEGLDGRRADPLVALPENEVRALLDVCERAGEVALAALLRQRLARAG